jgi:membrane protein DedA with SNARE-associated domain
MSYLSSSEFIHLLPYWGYPLMFIFMILEGPFATMICAFLASMGYFNVGIVFVLGVAGDLVGDIGLYYIGYFGGERALIRAEKFLRVKNSIIERIKKLFREKGERIIFSVKATTGLCAITFILAGTVRMSFTKFVKFSLLGGIVWSFALVLVGYFFGYAAVQISQYIKYAGLGIFLAAILIMIAINLFKKRESKEILENGEGV